MTRTQFLLFCLLLPLSVFFNCSNPLTESSPQTNPQLTFQDFLAQNNFQAAEDYYLYEGDIAFGKTEVEQLYTDFLNRAPDDNGSRGNIANDPYTGNRYVWTAAEKSSITYSFKGSLATRFLTDTQVRNAFRTATYRWMNTGTVSFSEVSTGGRFTVQTYRVPQSGNSIITAHSFFPHSSNPATFEINLVYLNGEAPSFPSPMYRTENEMVGLMTHELGHVLGLAHEHQRADSPYTFGQGIYGEPFGAYDAASIMNYANQPYTSGISGGDRALLGYLYGPSPVPVLISGPTILENSTPMLWTVTIPSSIQTYSIRYTVQRSNDPPFSWDTTSKTCSFSAYSPTPILITLQVTVTAPGYAPGNAMYYIYTRYNTGFPSYY